MSPWVCYNVLKKGEHYAGRGESHSEQKGIIEVRYYTEDSAEGNEAKRGSRVSSFIGMTDKAYS